MGIQYKSIDNLNTADFRENRFGIRIGNSLKK